MKQSSQKSKLCVRSIACIDIIYGKIFWIFSRPCTYISDVAIGEQVYCISNMCSHVVATGTTILIYAAAEMSPTRASPHAEKIVKGHSVVAYIVSDTTITHLKFIFFRGKLVY